MSLGKYSPINLASCSVHECIHTSIHASFDLLVHSLLVERIAERHLLLFAGIFSQLQLFIVSSKCKGLHVSCVRVVAKAL